MTESKLIQSLKLLGVFEFRQFEDYVNSPFFNKNKQVKALFGLLAPYFPDFEAKELTDLLAISKKLGLATKQQLYTLRSRLLQLLNEYLAQTQHTQNEFCQKTLAIQALRQQGSAPQLSSVIKQHQLLQEHYPFLDASIYYEKYCFHHELDQLFLTAPKRVYDQNLQLKSDYLDTYYIMTKLKLACDMTSRNIVIQANYTCGLLPAIRQVLDDQPQLVQQYAGIGIYYQILKMLESGEEQEYQKLKVLLEKHITDFPQEEMLQMYDYAQNYCIRQINTGNSAYYHEFINLYKTQLRHDILLRNGYLEEWDYKNITTAGIRTADYTWTEEFIHQMKGRLKPQVQDNAFTYNLAALYYATQRYQQTLQLLQTIEFTDPSYHLGAKIIQLKSYYELKEFDALQSLIKSFRTYVRRSKQLSEYRRKANLNMLKLAQKIARFQEERDFISDKKKEKDQKNILNLFDNLRPLANADWLKMIWHDLIN